ncbi:MAG: hypothetical protein SF187_19665 [Deltaproteobacteria bacterium]|nr:hypothetical protein [Deltaproteobacteria bacterium]
MSTFGFAALRHIEQGDINKGLHALNAMASGPQRDAWELALGAHTSLASPEHFVPPSLTTLAGIATRDPDVHSALAAACTALEKRAVIGLDTHGFAQTWALHQQLQCGEGKPETRLSLYVSRAWAKYLDIEPQDFDVTMAQLESVRREAADHQLSALLIEATVLSGLLALKHDQHPIVRGFVRRAALMAQSEGLPQSQYLAHAALARFRRYERRPHLAVRILASLRSVAPTCWRPWLDWECVMTGISRVNNETAPVAVDVAQNLERYLLAVSSGAPGASAAELALMKTKLQGRTDLLREARALEGCVDPSLPLSQLPPDVLAWAQGTTDVVPCGVDGVLFGRSEHSNAMASVYVAPHKPPRRLLSIAAPLLAAQEALPRVQRHNARIETAAATLALTGASGVTEEEFWRRVYGFVFVPALHKSTLDVLLHRLRERFDGTAEIVRHEGRLRFEPLRPMFLVDPRGMPGVDALLLKMLSERGSASARTAAETLAVPLRTVQSALADLVAEGHLKIEGKGRNVAYVVEDTVFAEPTRGA